MIYASYSRHYSYFLTLSSQVVLLGATETRNSLGAHSTLQVLTANSKFHLVSSFFILPAMTTKTSNLHGNSSSEALDQSREIHCGLFIRTIRFSRRFQAS